MGQTMLPFRSILGAAGWLPRRCQRGVVLLPPQHRRLPDIRLQTKTNNNGAQELEYALRGERSLQLFMARELIA
jgi:hypothetical protein